MNPQKKNDSYSKILKSFSKDPLWLYLLGINAFTFLLVDSHGGYLLASLLLVFSLISIHLLYFWGNLYLHEQVESQLEKFTADFSILPAIYLTDGEREGYADYIIISPKGIFSLRILDFEGILSGYENDEYWTYMKNISPYDIIRKTIKNPLHSHMRTQQVIEELLERNHIKYIPIQSLFIVNNSDALLESNVNLPVIKVKNLYRYINEYQDRSNMRSILEEINSIIDNERLIHHNLNAISTEL